MTKVKELKMALNYTHAAAALISHDNTYGNHSAMKRERDEIVRDLEALRQALAEPDTVAQATKSLAQEVIGCFDAAKAEGLYSAIALTTDKHLRDLVLRRLMCALYAAEEALSQALTEPEMPVDRGAWSGVPDATKWVDELRGDEQAEWVELTVEEMEDLTSYHKSVYGDIDSPYAFARAIEAKLRSKNG